MKKQFTIALSLFMTLGLGASAQSVKEIPVNTVKGISVAANGTDTLAVFGVTSSYENTENSFKTLACVVPKGLTTESDIESGLCYSSINTAPTIDDENTSIYTFKKSSRVHGVQLTGLKSGLTYYYRIFVKKADGTIAYGKTYVTKTVTSIGGTCTDAQHPHAIDLGLPSGTKWACCNVGANAPEQYGSYFAWGETSEKSSYSIDNYAFYTDNAYTDLGTSIASTSHDVAHTRMGNTWGMPTHEQQMELLNNCSCQWTTLNGINGMLVTGNNGNQIFLPATGYRYDGETNYVGEYGCYWSGTHDSTTEAGAYYLGTGPGGWVWGSDYARSDGRAVRAVCQ